jgi:hypothetical protein
VDKHPSTIALDSGARVPPANAVVVLATRRGGVSIFAGGAFLAGLLTLEIGPPLVGCNIKWNISYNTGERIYHVPRTGILLADTYKPLEGGAVVLL